MTMTVYHLKGDVRDNKKMSWLTADISTVVNFKDNFDKVADVYIDDALEMAFMLTNSIEDVWWNNKDVVKGDKDGYRCTSVGDVVKLSDGTYHMVDGHGWVSVDPSDPAKTKISSMLKEAAWDVEFINSKHFVYKK